jgi:FO synthase
MTIQAPPNLQPGELAALLQAGVNDWGGVSPVTPDHVNPEAPWPHLTALEEATEAAGRVLRERLAIGPTFAQQTEIWLDKSLVKTIRRMVDARGLPVTDGWHPGEGGDVPTLPTTGGRAGATAIQRSINRALAGERLDEREIVALFSAEGENAARILTAANDLRARVADDTVTYVVNRNINYTNICLYKCGFCAFSKGSTKAERGPAYKIDFEEIARRSVEAWARGATEVCLQGGIHPDYDGNTYLGVVQAANACSCFLAAGNLAWRFHAWPHTHGISNAPESRRAFHPAWHRRGNSGRQNPRHYMPRQAEYGRMGRGHARRPWRWPAHHCHHHVRPCRNL